jgi:hypothetical protein
MAWAGFQVLANRCVMWETEDGKIQCKSVNSNESYLYYIMFCSQ